MKFIVLVAGRAEPLGGRSGGGGEVLAAGLADAELAHLAEGAAVDDAPELGAAAGARADQLPRTPRALLQRHALQLHDVLNPNSDIFQMVHNSHYFDKKFKIRIMTRSAAFPSQF